MYECPHCGKTLIDGEICDCLDENNKPEKRRKALIIISILLFLFVAGYFVMLSSVNSYLRHSKVCAANANTKNLSIACQSALEELRTENSRDTSGRFILSSDKKYERIVYQPSPEAGCTSVTLDEIHDHMKYFFDFGNLDWVMVVEDNAVTYCASCQGWKISHLSLRNYVGTYPNQTHTKDCTPYDINGRRLSKNTDLKKIQKLQ